MNLPPNQDVIQKPDEQLVEDLIMHATSREWDLPPLSDAAGVSQEWRRAFLRFRIADLLAQLETGQRLKALDVEDRAWVNGQAQQLIDDAATYFTMPQGDAEYEPHKEYDPSEPDQVRRG